MTWVAAGNIASRVNSIKAEFPGITVYVVGDEAHASRPSDHNKDARSIVHALDAMTYADKARGRAIVEWLLEDTTDLEYVIFDRTIWSRSNNFRPVAYDGSDPHTDHVHASGKHGSVGYSSSTGTGYDTKAEAHRPAGFEGSAEDMTVAAQYRFNGFPDTPPERAGQIIVTNLVTWRWRPGPGEFNSVLIAGGARPLVEVAVKDLPPGTTFAQAVEGICGREDTAPAAGDGSDHKHSVSVSVSGSGSGSTGPAIPTA